MKKVMLIGYGAMAQAVIERLPPQVRVEWIVARESHHAAICLQFGQAVTPLTDPLQCGGTPDLVLECASQQAVAQYGEAVLARGWHLAVISTGALADSELEQRLRQAGGKLTLLAGAVAGKPGDQPDRQVLERHLETAGGRRLRRDLRSQYLPLRRRRSEPRGRGRGQSA